MHKYIISFIVLMLFGAGCTSNDSKNLLSGFTTTTSQTDQIIEIPSEVKTFLANREKQIQELITLQPSDSAFMKQAAVLLSAPYQNAVTEGRWKDLNQPLLVDNIYICGDADIVTSPKISKKISSKDGKSTIYLFTNGKFAPRTIGFFVTQNNRLTKTARLFIACKGSPSFDSIRWVDNKTVELQTSFMGDTSSRELLEVE